MREILFRGKTLTGKWVEGAYYKQEEFYGDKEDAHIIITSKETLENDFALESHIVIPETVGQYTGLTDKNGTKIFEGDIIRYADMYDYNCYLESLDNTEAYDKCDFGYIRTVDEVVYGIKIGYPAFDLNKHEWDCNGLSELNESGNYFYEVIGNIHDNSELLGDANV